MSYPCKKLKAWWVVYKVNPRERLHNLCDTGYHENMLEVGVDEIYQDDEVLNSFNVDDQVLPESLIGDRHDVVVPQKRKREPRKKKVTWRPLNRQK